MLTAEGIYRYLLRRNLSEYELAQLQRRFLVDDHGLWDQQQEDQDQKQDQQWKDRSEKTRTGMETVTAGQSTGGEAVLEQIQVATRDDVDYRAFLRRFAVPREVLEVDGDAFDYIYYTYGLQHYGNMPLVEPPETKEENRIEDFVIAVDTSMSTSGALVRQFLACTYAILRSTATFTRMAGWRRAPTLRRFWQAIQAAPGYHIVVAEEGEELVSTCTLLIVPNLTHLGRPHGLIENVVTHPAHRGKGLATGCLNFARQLAREQGCYKLMLMTGSKRQSTLRFYERAGYRSDVKTAFLQWL